MTYIKKIKTTDNNEHVIEAATVSGQGYGTCSSTSVSSGITTMLVEMNNDEYELYEKCVVAVRFSISVPANAKMDIEGKGAKPIYNNGSPIEDNIIKVGRKAVFVYDGNYYNLVMAETDGDNVKPDWEASEDASNGIKNKPNVRRGGTTGDASTAIIEGDITNNVAIGKYSHAEGTLSRASGEASHSEGSTTRATGDWSHSEGVRNIASGEASHSEGSGFASTTLQGVSGGSGSFQLSYSTPNPHNLSVGDILSYNFVYVYVTSTPTNLSFTTNETMGVLSGTDIPVFGHGAIGQYSHKEGRQTRAIGDQSHAEGNSTMSFGLSSHSEGYGSESFGESSHAEGVGTVTSNEGEHAEGKYNMSSTGKDDAKKTISSIGIGTNDSNRVNAVEVMANGNMYVYGVGDYDGQGSGETLQDVLSGIHQYTIVQTTPDSSYLTAYNLKEDATIVGTKINIPRDFVVKSGSINTVTSSDKAQGGKFYNNSGFSVGDKYLDLVNNSRDGGGNMDDEHVYINMKDLTDVYDASYGIGITNDHKFYVVINQDSSNGLSVGANGLALSLASSSFNGAMTSVDYNKINAQEIIATSSNKADLNDYKTVGTYITSGGYIGSSVQGNTLNTPPGSTGSFLLVVLRTTTSTTEDGKSIKQIYAQANGKVWSRQYYNGSWHSWIEENVKPDWEAASGTDAEILSKPNIVRGGSSGAPATAIVEGDIANNTAIGSFSHAEGTSNDANGEYSHAEGGSNTSWGDYSHTEGFGNNASGDYSHAEGIYTVTTNEGEHAEGRYNNSNNGSTDATKTIHSIGIGSSVSNRANAVEVMTNGNMYLYGVGGYDGTSISGKETLQEVISDISTNLTTKADKVTGATSGNFAGLDSSGNLTDSGHKHADYVTALGTSGNYVTWTKNGTANNLTVPYASVAGKLGTSTVGASNNPIYLNGGTPTPISSYPEAMLEWGGKNFSGSYGCIDAALISDLGANRTMFLKAGGISIEYSTNAGATWLDYGATDVQKQDLFSTGNSGFRIGKSTSATASANNMLRVTMLTSAGGVYTVLNKFAIYVSTEGSQGSYCTIRCRTQENYENNTDTWVTLSDHVPISGWTGWNIINTAATATYGNVKATQYGEWQFIFGCTGHSGASYAGLRVNKICGFGGMGWGCPSNMAKTGHIYSFDSAQNASFPAAVLPKDNATQNLGSSSYNWNGVYADKFIKKDGTSFQFLKADGSVDDNTYLTSTDISGKADKVTGATNGHLAGLDSSGNLTDSGYSASQVVNVKPDWEAAASSAAEILSKPNIVRGGSSGGTITAIVEGDIANNTAIGSFSHAEGTLSLAFGEASHSEGIGSSKSTTLQDVSGGSGRFPLSYSTLNPHNLSVGDILLYKSIYVYVTDTPTAMNFITNETMGVLSKSTVGVLDHGAIGQYSHKEGRQTRAIGDQSHAEGNSTMSFGLSSHSEGYGSESFGESSHAEGVGTVTSNEGEHAEGRYNWSDSSVISSIGIGESDIGLTLRKNAVTVKNDGSIYIFGVGGYEGSSFTDSSSLQEVLASVDNVQSNWEENNSSSDAYILNRPNIRRGAATGDASSAIVEGNLDTTFATGLFSHSEGDGAWALGYASHAEGVSTTADGNASHAEGNATQANANASHAEGDATTAEGNASHAEGSTTIASAQSAHAEGTGTEAKGIHSHAEGLQTQSYGRASHAEGIKTHALSTHSHSEGWGTETQSSFTISGDVGATTYTATGSTEELSVHDTINYGNEYTRVTGIDGNTITVLSTLDSNNQITNKTVNIIKNIASANASHTENFAQATYGKYSHAEGVGTITFNEGEHAEGRYNFSQLNSSTQGNYGNVTHSIGIGTSQRERKNATMVMQDGSVYVFGIGGYLGTYISGKETLQQVISDISTDLTNKADKVTGATSGNFAGLDSSGNLTDSGYSASQVVNVKPNWEAASGADSEILNIPQIKRGGSSDTAATAIIEGQISGAAANVATGFCSHAEGYSTKALGNRAHAEGSETIANGNYSHAEGNATYANSSYSHSEGAGVLTALSFTFDGPKEDTTSTYTANVAHGLAVNDILYYQPTNKVVRVTSVSGLDFTTSSAISSSQLIGASVSKKTGVAFEYGSHTEGWGNVAIGAASHAEGYSTLSVGEASHSEGRSTKATGSRSHAEGYLTTSSGSYSHSEGTSTTSSGAASHSEGSNTTSSGSYSHSEGYRNTSSGSSSHSEGYSTTATGNYSHAEGCFTKGLGGTTGAHVEGTATTVAGVSAHAEGTGSASPFAYVVRQLTCSGSNPYTSTNAHSLSLGVVVRIDAQNYTYVTEVISNTEFRTKDALSASALSNTTVNCTTARVVVVDSVSGATVTTTWNHGLRIGNIVRLDNTYRRVDAVPSITSFTTNSAIGASAGSEIFVEKGISYATHSHTEGYLNTATGAAAHAEGGENIAHASYSHAEGYNNQSRGTYSHTEGYNNQATGAYSHAEGNNGRASGSCSHTEGLSSIAYNEYEHAEGSYNNSNNGSTNATKTRHSVGIGTSGSNRANAVEVMANGDYYLYNVGGYDGTTITDKKTLQTVLSEHDSAIEGLQEGVAYFDRVKVGARGLLQDTLCAFNIEEELVSLVYPDPKGGTKPVANTIDRFPHGAKIYYYTGNNVSGDTNAYGITLFATFKHADMRKMLFGATTAVDKEYIGATQSPSTAYVNQSALFLNVEADRYCWYVKVTDGGNMVIPYKYLEYEQTVIRLGCHNASATTDTDWYSMNLEDNNPMYRYETDDEEDPVLTEYHQAVMYDMLGDIETALDVIINGQSGGGGGGNN